MLVFGAAVKPGAAQRQMLLMQVGHEVVEQPRPQRAPRHPRERVRRGERLLGKRHERGLELLAHLLCVPQDVRQRAVPVGPGWFGEVDTTCVRGTRICRGLQLLAPPTQCSHRTTYVLVLHPSLAKLTPSVRTLPYLLSGILYSIWLCALVLVVVPDKAGRVALTRFRSRLCCFCRRRSKCQRTISLKRSHDHGNWTILSGTEYLVKVWTQRCTN
jgi:hypothetical protein